MGGDCHATAGGHDLEFLFLRCLRHLWGKSDTLSVQVCHPGLKIAWLHSVGEGKENPGRSRSLASVHSICITGVFLKAFSSFDLSLLGPPVCPKLPQLLRLCSARNPVLFFYFFFFLLPLSSPPLPPPYFPPFLLSELLLLSLFFWSPSLFCKCHCPVPRGLGGSHSWFLSLVSTGHELYTPDLEQQTSAFPTACRDASPYSKGCSVWIWSCKKKGILSCYFLIQVSDHKHQLSSSPWSPGNMTTTSNIWFFVNITQAHAWLGKVNRRW